MDDVIYSYWYINRCEVMKRYLLGDGSCLPSPKQVKGDMSGKRDESYLLF